MRTSHKVEERHKAKDRGRISSKGIIHQGSSSSSSKESKERNEYQGQKRTQSFEEQMLQFMGDNKKLLHTHEQNLLSSKLLNPTHKCFNQTSMLP